MTITASIYEIAVLLIAIGFAVFLIALVPALLQLKATLKTAEDLCAESKKTVESLNYLLRKAEEQTGEFEELFKRFRDAGLKMADMTETVVSSIRSPILTIISLIMGIEHVFKKLFSKEETEGGGNDGKE